MGIKLFVDHGLSVLPPMMDTINARAMLFAIGLQESGFQYRRQINGPAKSFWQFEKSGIYGVFTHRATKGYIGEICRMLRVRDPEEAYRAIEWNDTMACALARLLLWTIPEALPDRDNVQGAWNQYRWAWRPGKPRIDDWYDNYVNGWAVATGEKDYH